MPRVMLIVPDDEREVEHWLDLAQREGAGEILRGVPPYLAKELADRDLPLVHVEEDPPVPPTPPTPEPTPLEVWAQTAQAELLAQRQILDLLLLGGLDDHGGTVDDETVADLPDSGGTLDDLEGLDLGTLPDSGETLDDLDLASLEG